MKKIIVICLIVCVLVFGAYFFAFSSPSDEASANAQPQNQAVMVSTTIIKAQPIDTTIKLPGRITAHRQSQVRPQVNGIVTKRFFEEGAQVEQGAQLYQIDDAQYKALLNSAMADLNSAQANIKSIEAKAERYVELVKVNAVSQQDYEDLVAQLDQGKASVAIAQAAVDLASVNLDYTKVYAPISGKIGRSLVTEGALVTSNQPEALAVITQLDPVYVDMQQSGDGMVKIQMHLSQHQSIPVNLTIGDAEKIAYAHQGELKFSEVNVEQTTGSVTLRALIPNPDMVLLPGMFVRATLHLGENNAVLVPQRATIRQSDGTLAVWVVDENNQADKRVLIASATHDDNWIVDSGVNENDKIVVVGYQKLSQGMTVNPTIWQAEQISKDKE